MGCTDGLMYGCIDIWIDESIIGWIYFRMTVEWLYGLKNRSAYKLID